MSTPPMDAQLPIPMVDAQPEAGPDGSKVDPDTKEELHRTVGPDVIDRDTSESVNKSNQVKLDDLSSEIEPAPSAPAEPTTSSTPADEKASEPAPAPDASAKSASSPLPSPRRLSNMPAMTDLSDLILHSPSSQIIGTPFATNTTRFEYPFPETNPGSGSSSPPSSPPMTTAFPPPLASGSSFPAISTSLSASEIPSATLTYPLLSPSEMPSYNSTHPKLKAQKNPPVPPSLQKKKHRWSLNLLGRRKSSYGSQSSVGSGDSTGSAMTIDSILAGAPQVSSPQGSPREERGKE